MKQMTNRIGRFLLIGALAFIGYRGLVSMPPSAVLGSLEADFAHVVDAQSTPTAGPDFFIAQTAQGAGTGADCADALPVAWFKDASNWGGGSSQIGQAGTVVHLCGTFTAPAGTTNYLQFYGGGGPGSPLTLRFEDNALIQAPYWIGPVINLNGNSYITVDGGTNGLIQATANGTDLAYQDDNSSTGVASNQNDTGGSNLTVENLTVANLYVHAYDPTDEKGGSTNGISIDGGNNISIHNNTIHDARWCIGYDFPGGMTSSNISIYSNTAYDCDHGVSIGSGNTDAILNTVSIYDNNIYDGYLWDDNAVQNHHDGIHTWTAQGGTAITGLKVYDNYIHGNWGTNLNSFLFGDVPPGTQTGAEYFNNVLVDQDTYSHEGCGYICLMGYHDIVVNNTVIGSSAGLDFYGAGMTVENNIDGGGIFFASGDQWWTGGYTIDHNDYFNVGSNTFNNQTGTLSVWQTGCGGCDMHSFVGDPDLSSTYQPNSGSPVIGAGINLASVGNTSLGSDYAGTARPAGCGPWDIGAYESTSGSGGPTTCTLTVTPPTGGTITSSPSGIDCGPGEDSCTQSDLTAGSNIALTVTPQTDYLFDNWQSGCSSVSGTTCNVVMSADTTVSAAVSSSGGFTPPACSGVCDATLKGYWPFEEGSGSTAFDSSTYADNGSEVNSPTYVTGAVGSHALSFNGSTQYVDLGDPSALQITGQITLSAWVDFSSFPTTDNSCAGNCGTIIAKGYNEGDYNNEGYFLRYVNQGTPGTPLLSVGSLDNGTYYTTAWPITFSTGSWHHVVGLYDGTDWKLYVDGAQVASDPAGTGAIAVGADASIGAEMGAPSLRVFPGSIDDVRIYSTGLSSDHVLQLYHLGIGSGPTTYSLSYAAGTNGALAGEASQSVSSGGNGTAVTAVPNAGYAFSSWSDGSTENPRTDADVTADLSVSAAFAAVPAAAAPAGCCTGGSGGGGGGSSAPAAASVSRLTVAVAPTAAILSWTTPSAALVQVSYGLTAAYGSHTALTSLATTTHGALLSGLSPNTLYHYALLSKSPYQQTLASTEDDTFVTATAGTAAVPAPPAPASAVPVPLLTAALSLGSSNPQVKVLQELLNGDGYQVSLSGNGSPGHESAYFGPATLQALVRFQCAAISVCTGAPGSGLVGPRTRAALNALGGRTAAAVSPVPSPAAVRTPAAAPVSAGSAPAASTGIFTRTLTLGSTGPDVKALQAFLNAHGFLVAASGPGSPGAETASYDAATAAAVSRFQEAYASEILAPYGLTQGTGVFGKTTIKIVESMEEK